MSTSHNIPTTSVRDLLSAVRERGWQVERRKAGHIRLHHPQGGLVFVASTPSDHRALRNIAAEIRRQERQR